MTTRVFRFALLAAAACGLAIALAARPTAQQSASLAAPMVQAPAAKEVIDTALATARKDNKNVFIHFSASWCGLASSSASEHVAVRGSGVPVGTNRPHQNCRSTFANL